MQAKVELRPCAKLALRHAEGVELVAVGVPEIGGVEAAAAITGWALVLGAHGHRQLVDAVDLSGVFCGQGRHDAVADCRSVAVERLGQADSRAAAGFAPS